VTPAVSQRIKLLRRIRSKIGRRSPNSKAQFCVVNVETAAKRLLKAPFRTLGMDVVRWCPPKSQPVIPLEELEMVAAFGPQYKPEDHWLPNCGIKTVLDVGAYMGEFTQRPQLLAPARLPRKLWRCN
jgi:hypothetical protein